jgi:predicted Rossmann-fold nucleotide-binding protein
VCVDRDYWTRTINFDLLLEAQVISPADFHLLRFADDAKALGRNSPRPASRPRIQGRSCALPMRA